MEEKEITEQQAADKSSGETGVLRELLYWVGVIVFAVVFSQVMTRFVIINAVVPSGSMEDTIQIDNRLMGLRFAYWFSEPQRGDVVIFEYPVDESRNYIKRVIGLPGEHIDITGGKVYINGSTTALTEDYIKEEWVVESDGLSYDVPEGCYFMLGDNRNNSADSRYWAYEAMAAGIADSREDAEHYTFVRADQILGKAYFVYYDHFQVIR